MKGPWSLVALAFLSSPCLAEEGVPAKPAQNDLPAGTATFFNPQVPPASHILEEGQFEESHSSRGFSNFIGFLSNPLQSIDPRAINEIYPIFGSSWITTAAPIPDGNFQVYGAGLTIALSDRLAVGLNQGGFADAHFSHFDPTQRALIAARLSKRFDDKDYGGNRDGFLNLGGFFQYTLIENEPEQFLFTGGIRWEAPCGSHEMFQGYGPAHLAPYWTAGKALGQFHVLATSGYQFPVGPGSDNTQLFYGNLHLDRQCFNWLYPLVEFNWTYHVTSAEFGLVTRRGFVDTGNFESTGNILTLAVGANAVIQRDRLEIGAAYSTPLASQQGFNFNGLTVKMVLRY
jgi:hypothetical protein